MKKFISLLSFILLLCFSVSSDAEVFKKDFEAGQIEKLKISNTSGSILIKGSPDGKSSIDVKKVKMDKGCKMRVDHSGKTLLVEIKNTSWFGKSECRADMTVLIPDKASADVRSGAGDIKVSNLTEHIDFRLGSGNLAVEGAPTKIEGKVGSGDISVNGQPKTAILKTGSGNISFRGESKRSELSTGSGNISLRLDKVLKNSSIRITSGSGDAEIYAPSDSKIATDFSAGSGELYDELGQSEKPDLKIKFSAGSGDLKLKKIK